MRSFNVRSVGPVKPAGQLSNIRNAPVAGSRNFTAVSNMQPLQNVRQSIGLAPAPAPPPQAYTPTYTPPALYTWNLNNLTTQQKLMFAAGAAVVGGGLIWFLTKKKKAT